MQEQKIPVEKYEHALDQESGMLVFLGTEKLAIGYFVLSDKIKEGSREAVQKLKSLIDIIKF